MEQQEQQPPEQQHAPQSPLQERLPRLTFEEAVRSCFRHYTKFEGRARRSEFWWFWVFNFLLSVIAILLDSLFFNINITPITPDTPPTIFGEIGIFSALVSLGLFLPYLSVLLRRLHDTNRSGWWVLVYIFGVPIFALGLNIMPQESYLLYVLAFLSLTLYFALWLAEHGTRGDNRYGTDPTSPRNRHTRDAR